MDKGVESRLEMSLDDIIKKDKGSFRGRGRGRGRGGGISRGRGRGGFVANVGRFNKKPNFNNAVGNGGGFNGGSGRSFGAGVGKKKFIPAAGISSEGKAGISNIIKNNFVGGAENLQSMKSKKFSPNPANNRFQPYGAGGSNKELSLASRAKARSQNQRIQNSKALSSSGQKSAGAAVAKKSNSKNTSGEVSFSTGYLVEVFPLNLDVEEDDVRELFSKYGNVKNVEIKEIKIPNGSVKLAVIKMKKQSDANDAIMALNGKPLDGTVMHVKLLEKSSYNSNAGVGEMKATNENANGKKKGEKSLFKKTILAD